jgi:AcrR family transcriptional regulator
MSIEPRKDPHMTDEPHLNRRQQAKARTRAKVLEAARVLFEAKGYDAATIREIAKGAGMSTGAVFANFEDKAHLYETIQGHPPVPVEHGAHLLKIVRGLALNGRYIRADEPFGGALERLLVLARGRLAEVWPEGLRGDVLDQYEVEPAEALVALEAALQKEPPPAPPEYVTGRPRITPGGLLQMARLLEESEPALARELRQRAETRALEAHDRLKAKGLVS